MLDFMGKSYPLLILLKYNKQKYIIFKLNYKKYFIIKIIFCYNYGLIFILGLGVLLVLT